MPIDDMEWIRRAVESGARIKLAPGVIGKSSMMWLITTVAWIVGIARLSATGPLWFDAMLLGGPIVLTLAVMRETAKMRAFAETNPGTALLEGAELTEFKRMEAQSKGLLGEDTSPPITGAAVAVGDPTDNRGASS